MSMRQSVSRAIIATSFLLLAPPRVAAGSQTPWQTNAYGTLRINMSWNYAMGYHFTPQVNGQVTGLGGFFKGTKTVKLFNKATGQLLASATVTASNTWNYTAITPVTVTAGTTYTVAVYLAGSGGSYRSALRPALPRTFGDIRIESSTYAYTAKDQNARPTNAIVTVMYGQADIMFEPATGGDTTPPTGTISINNGAASTNTTAVTLTLSATDNAGPVSQMQFSNDGTSYSTPEPYATTKSWSLSTGDGTKTVSAKFKDAAGNWSSAVSDTIVLDTTPPTTPVVTDDGASTASATQLHATWTASTDRGSGVVEYQLAIGTTSGGTDVVGWTSVGLVTEFTRTGLSLINGQTYYT